MGPIRNGGSEVPASPWPLLAALALLVAVNLLNTVIAPGRYLLWSLLGTAALILLARADGLRRPQWGLGPVTGRVLAASAALAAVTAGVMLVGAILPGTAQAYLDERVVGMSAGEAAFAALVRAPLGTALLEEVAFRGVLLAMLVRRFGVGPGVIGSCVAFGIWHVVPALGLAAGNAAVGSAVGAIPGLAAALAVAAAAMAGGLLCLLRIRSGHLLPPLAVHATATGLGYLLAWLAVNR